MGNQSVVIIRNDAIGEIRRNPEQFVNGLLDAIERVAGNEHKGVDFGCGYHANPARVVAVHHSDTTVIVDSGGATGRQLATLHKWRWPSYEEKLRAIIHELEVEAAGAKYEGK